MREIKFRAWDTVAKQIRLEALQIKDIGLGEGSVIASEEVQTNNPLEWMQFTGLLDKNGKEIYEGDILSFDKAPYHKTHLVRLAVIFEDGAFTAGIWRISSANKKRIEIIGNIYENPELLNS